MQERSAPLLADFHVIYSHPVEGNGSYKEQFYDNVMTCECSSIQVVVEFISLTISV